MVQRVGIAAAILEKTGIEVMEGGTLLSELSEEKRLVIGKNGNLPFKVKEDLKHFVEITKDGVVVMGRKTFDSIGHPLSDRVNIVLTHDEDWSHTGIVVENSLDAAITFADAEAEKKKQDEIFIIGGARVYEEAMPILDKFLLTLIIPHESRNFRNGVTIFPKNFFEQEWTRVTVINHLEGIKDHKSNKKVDAHFLSFERGESKMAA